MTSNLTVKFGYLGFILVLTLAYILSCKPIIAQYYGQGSSKSKIVVDKLVRPITDTKFYDNIGSDQKVFVEGDIVEFKIRVENTGNETLLDVKLTDLLPSNLKLIFYPGIFNKTTNRVETDIGTLEAGESREYLIRAKIDDLPASVISNKIIQVVNKADVVSNKASDNDEAKYYLASKSIPTTGTNDIALKTLLVMAFCGTGVILRKLSRGF